MGGRWLGNLKLKLGRKGSLGEPGVDRNSPKFDCDQARKGDIDFEGMLDACRQEAERIWQEAEGKDELRRRLLFGVDGGETREQFIARNSVPLNVHAVVKNGKWFEYGEMGWFGVSINEKEVKDWQGELRDLLADVSDDTLLTVVDCHI